jgi:hypothetical protein
MKPFNLKLGILVASFTLAAAPAFAQKPESGGSPGGGAVDRSSGAGATSNSGGAVDRGSGGGGGGGGSTVASSSSSGSSNSGSTYSSPSASASSSPSISFGDRGMRQNAPEHRPGFSNARAYAADESGQKATPRSSGPSGGGNGGGAVTRGGGSSGGSTSSGGGTRAGSGDSGASRAPARTRTAPSADASAPANNASGTREVPNWARPRGDHPVSGQAKDRTVPPPDRNGNYRDRYGYGYGGYYDPFYNSGYSPFYGDYYYPYGFGMGYGLYSGFGWAPYVGDPYGDPYGGIGGGGSSTSYGRGEQGNLKLKVKPRAAKVYVDGYFVGTVDQFDGSFQKLALNTGRHKVEVKADGFQTAEFDVLINPEQTVTFQGDLKRIQ